METYTYKTGSHAEIEKGDWVVFAEQESQPREDWDWGRVVDVDYQTDQIVIAWEGSQQTTAQRPELVALCEVYVSREAAREAYSYAIMADKTERGEFA